MGPSRGRGDRTGETPLAPPIRLPHGCRRRLTLDRHGRCSYRLALYRPRVVDIELDMLAGEGRRGDLRRALRRVKAVPHTLRNDSDHSGAKRKRLGRPVVAHDFQGRSAVEDVNKLVAAEMGFPMIFTRELDREKGTVAVGSQS